jgi:hypothetical protein
LWRLRGFELVIHVLRDSLKIPVTTISSGGRIVRKRTIEREVGVVTMINEITIPSDYVDVAGRWYDGMDMLYAVCSTGGLTTGTSCPVRDYDGLEDRDVKWYYGLWLSLSGDVGRARRAAEAGHNGESDSDDAAVLAEFEDWIDNEVLPQLEAGYPGLEDWSGE